MGVGQVNVTRINHTIYVTICMDSVKILTVCVNPATGWQEAVINLINKCAFRVMGS